MRVLIIGASSFLGRKVYKCLLEEGIETIGTYFMNRLGDEKHNRKLDLLKFDEVRKILSEVNPEVIIILSAISTVEECEGKKSLALTINTFSVGHIAEWCLEKNKHLVFISSECVFEGLSGPYYEWSPHSPINFYGKTKALAEQLILTINCPFSIIRLPLLYGYNDEFDKDTLLKTVIKSLSNGKKLRLDNKRIKYPTLIDDIARALLEVIKGDLRGIFHFSSPEALTKFEFGLEVASVFGFDKSLVSGIPMEECIPKPYKVELVNTRLPKLKFVGVRKGLSIVKEQILENVDDVRRAYI